MAPGSAFFNIFRARRMPWGTSIGTVQRLTAPTFGRTEAPQERASTAPRTISGQGSRGNGWAIPAVAAPQKSISVRTEQPGHFRSCSVKGNARTVPSCCLSWMPSVCHDPDLVDLASACLWSGLIEPTGRQSTGASYGSEGLNASVRSAKTPRSGAYTADRAVAGHQASTVRRTRDATLSNDASISSRTSEPLRLGMTRGDGSIWRQSCWRVWSCGSLNLACHSAW